MPSPERLTRSEVEAMRNWYGGEAKVEAALDALDAAWDALEGFTSRYDADDITAEGWDEVFELARAALPAPDVKPERKRS